MINNARIKDNNREYQRPVSPHLTIYKRQISSVLSIFHRITGIYLFTSLVAISWWFILWVYSDFSPCYLLYWQYWPIKLATLGVVYAWFYHLTNGVRHLMWDSGIGFSIKAIDYSGWAVVIISTILTSVTSIVIIL